MSLISLWPWTTTTRKRQPRQSFASGLCSETLELRQMLSAVNTLGDEAVALAAETSTSQFELTFSDESTTTGTLTYKGTKATYVTSLGEIGEITLKGKIQDDTSIPFKGTKKTELGKVKVTGIITEAAAESDWAFDGEYTAKLKKEVIAEDTFTGDYTDLSAPLAAPVETTWELTFDDESTSEAYFTVKGKKMSVETVIDGVGVIMLKGKQSKEDPTTYNLKAGAKVEGDKVTVYATVSYLSETEVDGSFEVHVKKVGVVNDGTFVGDLEMPAPLAVGLDAQIAATGTWDLEFGMNDVGLSTGEAVLKDVGKKGKVKGKLYDAFDKTIKLKGQRSENDFNTIVFTGKVNTPLGKQSVTVNLELLDDDLFEGTADVGGIIVEFAGNLQPAAATALKITPPNVTGTWLIEVEDNELDITEGTLVITQKGLKVLATLDADVLEQPVQLKGKFNKKDLDDIISKGRFPIPGSNFRPRLNVTLAINDQQNPTAFTGNIYRSIFGNVIADVDFTGTKQI